MSCQGRGLCGCGAPACAVAEWWFFWCGIWIVIGHDLFERELARRA